MEHTPDVNTRAATASDRRRLLLNLLGDLPPRGHRISVVSVAREERADYVLESLELDLNGIEPVPAYFLMPHNLPGPAPALLYHHAHGGTYDVGRDELLNGRPQLLDPPYSKVLTGLGCCVLAIDHWNFGTRHRRTESSLFKEMLWNGRTLWGMMIYDSLRALDYLCSREEVDVTHIGNMGLSMGSTLSWWTAALDERVSLCIDLCCLTDYEALIEDDGLDRHGLYYFVPGLLKHFSTAQINELIAPRTHLALAGIHDPLTPAPGLDRIDAHLREVYESAGAPQNWELSRHDCGHEETPAMRAEIIDRIRRWADA